MINRKFLLGFLFCCIFSGLSAQNGFNLQDLHKWSQRSTSETEEVQRLFSLEVDQRLNPEKKLFSEDQSHYLTIQGDGNLCVYTNKDAFVWCTMSNGQKPGCYLVLQDDGHLCIYNSEDHFVWGSNTYLLENKPISLYLANDGKLQLLDINNNSVWTSE